MKKIFKKYFLVLLSLLCVILMSGCKIGEKNLSPTETVSNKLDSIKSGNVDDVFTNLGNGIIKFKRNNGIKELFPNSSEKMTGLLSGINYTINSEKIDGNEAVVNVTLNGPELNEPVDKLIQSIISDINSGELSIRNIKLDEITNKYDEEFSKSLVNVKNSERTMDIELEKKLGKWEIEDEDDLCKLTTNIDVDEFVDKYDDDLKK